MDPSPIRRALASLEGLALGDALGERFFGHPPEVAARISGRRLPEPVWRWTDDTLMACSIVEVLASHGEASPPALATSFAHRFDARRGYGAAAAGLLDRIRRGAADWRSAGDLFDGSGSFGNGAAMRVAPLGAYHCDDLERVAAEADRSAIPTHTHSEGRAGAVAVAVAAALSARGGHLGPATEAGAFLLAVAERTPDDTRVRRGLERAARMPPSDHS